MVQPIGSTDNINRKAVPSNRNAIKKAVENAYRAYSYDNLDEYNKHMSTYYREGMNNPTLAKIIFYDTVRDAALEEKDKVDELSKSVNELKKYSPRGVVEPMVKENAEKVASSINTSVKILHAQKAFRAVSTEMGDKLSDEVKPLREAFEGEFNRLYPSSAEARQRAIREYRLSDTGRTLKNQERYASFEKYIKTGEAFAPIEEVVKGILDYFDPNKKKPSLLQRLLKRAKK